MNKQQEEKDSLKWNVKKEKIKQEKEKKRKRQQQSLLRPPIKNNFIIWADKNNNGSLYEGTVGKEKCFEIKKGILTFSLKIINKEVLSINKNYNSIELVKLQKKAHEILCNNSIFLRKFKAIS